MSRIFHSVRFVVEATAILSPCLNPNFRKPRLTILALLTNSAVEIFCQFPCFFITILSSRGWSLNWCSKKSKSLDIFICLLIIKQNSEKLISYRKIKNHKRPFPYQKIDKLLQSKLKFLIPNQRLVLLPTHRTILLLPFQYQLKTVDNLCGE